MRTDESTHGKGPVGESDQHSLTQIMSRTAAAKTAGRVLNEVSSRL